jgi:L-ascorbate metabolism protein UlaG (beta-lactamase superfamily)
MRKVIITLLSIFVAITAFSQIKVSPVNHASFIIQSGDVTIFVDPVEDIKKYRTYPTPQLILITHAHGDHFSKSVIDAVKNDKTTIVGPEVVTTQLGVGKTVANGTKISSNGIEIEAIPMYNTTPERLNYHPKGIGNGYVITLNGERIYIAGDTEDIPEMRALKDIDHAFICMNLPYTMTPEQAASAVLEFKPKQVYPYHYRQKEGLSDIEKFRELVSVNPRIDVVFLKWY